VYLAHGIHVAADPMVNPMVDLNWLHTIHPFVNLGKDLLQHLQGQLKMGVENVWNHQWMRMVFIDLAVGSPLCPA